MREVLERNGWKKSGSCNCGTTYFTNPEKPGYRLNVQFSNSVFKIMKDGRDVIQYTAAGFMEEKLKGI